MKKITCILIILSILFSILTGCDNKTPNQPSAPPSTSNAPTTTPPQTPPASTNGGNMEDFWMDDGELFDLAGYAETYGFEMSNDPKRPSPPSGAYFTRYDEDGLEIRSIYLPDIPGGSHVAVINVAPDPDNSSRYIAITYQTYGMLPNDESINSGKQVKLFDLDPSLGCTIYAGTKLEALCELIKAASDLSIENPIYDIHEKYGSTIGLYRITQSGIMSQSTSKNTRYYFEATGTITPDEKIR